MPSGPPLTTTPARSARSQPAARARRDVHLAHHAHAAVLAAHDDDPGFAFSHDVAVGLWGLAVDLDAEWVLALLAWGLGTCYPSLAVAARRSCGCARAPSDDTAELHQWYTKSRVVRAAQPGLKRMAHVGAAKTISTRSSAPLTGGSGSTKRWGAVMTIPWSLATGLPALHQA